MTKSTTQHGIGKGEETGTNSEVSEISETIFSQCNNFIAMRLTNPVDQGYVKKLLPDTLGALIDTIPSLKLAKLL
ncbi:hypothetical protein ACX0G9_18040 [Flavitalea flava]